MSRTEEPTISIIIPTYNAEKTLPICLKSIAMQDYPRDKIEIIIADGGSKDNTLKIAKPIVDKIINNPLIFEEMGKPLAIDVAENEILAFIDSDNIMPSKEWIRRMVEPFKDPEIVASEPLFYEYRKTDELITRYCSLIGADDAIYPYLGSYDRFCYFKGKWTEVPLLMVEDKGGYLKIKLKDEVPTMGANGFLIRKEVFKKTKYKPLHLHVDIIYQLVDLGFNCMAKVKVGIVHLHSENLSTYIRKKIRRIQKRFVWKHYYRSSPINKSNLLRFVTSIILLFPLAMDIAKGYKKISDIAWFFHFIACILSLSTYAIVAPIYLLVRKAK